jgi:hypothetical protein
MKKYTILFQGFSPEVKGKSISTPPIKKHLSDGGWCRFLIKNNKNGRTKVHQVFSMSFDSIKGAIHRKSTRSVFQMTPEEIKEITSIDLEDPKANDSLWNFFVKYTIRELISESKRKIEDKE